MKRKILPILISLVCLISGAGAQTVTNHKTEESARKAAGQGIVYKIPGGVMALPKWDGFRGMIMLAEKQPWGIFISYPDEGETLDALKLRAGKWIARMFVHDEAMVDKIDWQSKTAPSNKGDIGDTALQRSYDNETETFQITYFEREYSGLKLVYGYFARKGKTSKDKDDSGDFLGEKGKGNKSFQAFWKSFPE